MKSVWGAMAASFVVAVAILLLSFTTIFAGLNSTAYDFTLRIAGRVEPASPTVIVAIDDESLFKIGRWPWSRQTLAQLIERLAATQPRTVAMDIILDEKTTADADTALATAIAHTSSLVLATRRDFDQGVERWRDPLAIFVQKHVRLGHVHTDPDFDGIGRKVLYVKPGDGRVVPALAVQALHAAELPFKSDFEQTVNSAQILRPEFVNIRFVGDNNSFSQVPAWKVLDGSVDPSLLKGKIVLLGSTAEGGDQWFTPFSTHGQKMSGVEIHANAIDTLYAGRAITESSEIVVLLGLAIFGFMLWYGDRRFEGKQFYATVVFCVPAAVAISVLLMKWFNFWFSFLPFWTELVVIPLSLEAWKIARVNRDLDRKIDRLSSGWIDAVTSYHLEPARTAELRNKLLGRLRRNSRWRLEAVDSFNEELMRFLSFNNAILASIEDVIIVSDRTCRVVYQNPAAMRLEEARENPGPVAEYLALHLKDHDFAPVFAGVQEKGETRGINFVPARNGRSFYNVVLAPIPGAGVVVSLHDSTAQYELNQAKSDMVSLVSHELRTPLTSIRGYSDMLLKYGLVQEKGRDFLGTIIDESNRLNQLIQSFLDIAYIESGRQKISKTDFEIGQVLKDMVTVINPVAAEKQIAIETPANVNGMRIQADRLLLYQALTNLVTNAIKYSPAGTTVRIGISNGAGRVRFQVADQGCGIPAEDAAKIFDKFYRRANKETREQSGFGLGLAFVKEVATRHGGDVSVESEVGKGSVFTLSIPN